MQATQEAIPVAKRRRYQATSVNRIEAASVERLGDQIIVGIDVAKRKQFALLARSDGEPDGGVLLSWVHPEETNVFFALCTGMRERGQKVTMVLEPTGTYGDPFLHWFWQEGFETRRVLGKQVADAAAAFDGISSSHDAKAAVMLVKLHQMGGSKPWLEPSEATRKLRALEAELSWHDDGVRRLYGKMEALLARHWPELTNIIKPRSKVFWHLLAEYRSPRRVADCPQKVRTFLRKRGGAFLKDAKIDAIVESAGTTVGAWMLPAEENWVGFVATNLLVHQEQQKILNGKMRALLATYASDELVELLGPRTTATLIAYNLDPLRFTNARAFIKALGLSLKEHSSGQYKGRLRITKRGAPRVRWLMVLSALRLVARDRVVNAWHFKKRARDGVRTHAANGLISAVAVARKLAAAAWHVARGEAFDASKLFDTSRLVLSPAPSTEVVEPSVEVPEDFDLLMPTFSTDDPTSTTEQGPDQYRTIAPCVANSNEHDTQMGHLGAEPMATASATITSATTQRNPQRRRRQRTTQRTRIEFDQKALSVPESPTVAGRLG